MNRHKLAILCDFDGTVTKRDVGFHIYTRFGDERWEEINKSWRRGEISSKDCLIGEYSLIDASEEEVREYIMDMEIDDGFPELVSICRENDIPLAIVSDGFDFYISTILEKYGLGDLQVFCNEMRFDGRRVVLSFPYYDQGCGVCGNCKKLHVDNFRKNFAKVVYIGDGLSDKFAARASDIVFAKDELKDYLEKNEVDFHEFCCLDDVNKWLAMAIDEVDCFITDKSEDPCKEARFLKSTKGKKEVDKFDKEILKDLKMKKIRKDMGDGRYIIYYEWS